MGSSVFQPLRHRRATYDHEAEAVTLGSGGVRVVKRPGVSVQAAGTSYDSLAGSDFQMSFFRRVPVIDRPVVLCDRSGVSPPGSIAKSIAAEMDEPAWGG